MLPADLCSHLSEIVDDHNLHASGSLLCEQQGMLIPRKCKTGGLGIKTRQGLDRMVADVKESKNRPI